MALHSILRTITPTTVNIFEHIYHWHCHLFKKKKKGDIIWRSSQNNIIVCCFSAHLTSDIRYKNTFNRRIAGKSKLAALREARLQTHLPRTLSRTSLLEPALSLALIWHSYTPASFTFTFLIIRFQLPRYGICCTWYLSSGM